MSYHYQGLGRPIGHSQIIRDLNGFSPINQRVGVGLAGVKVARHPQHGHRMHARTKPSQWANMGGHGPSHPN
jgi:hypothetical protein